MVMYKLIFTSTLNIFPQYSGTENTDFTFISNLKTIQKWYSAFRKLFPGSFHIKLP